MLAHVFGLQEAERDGFSEVSYLLRQVAMCLGGTFLATNCLPSAL